MSKEKECPMCHKVGFHKISCPTQKVTVFLSDEITKKQRRCKNHVWRKDYLNGGKKCQVCMKTDETDQKVN